MRNIYKYIIYKIYKLYIMTYSKCWQWSAFGVFAICDLLSEIYHLFSKRGAKVLHIAFVYLDYCKIKYILNQRGVYMQPFRLLTPSCKTGIGMIGTYVHIINKSKIFGDDIKSRSPAFVITFTLMCITLTIHIRTIASCCELPK